MDSISLLPILSPLLLTLIFIALALLLLLGPNFKTLDRKKLSTLVGLRALAILLALLACLRPGCVKITEQNQTAVLMFLLDTTRSMELPHVSDDSTRWSALKTMVESNADKFRALNENKIDVRFYGFDTEAYPIEVIDGVVTLPEIPEGPETDLGTPIFETGIESRGERLIGIFLGSDGMQTASSPEVELAAAIDTLKDLEVPLFSVLFGLPGDSGHLADVAIKNFAEQHVVNVKNNLNATATLVARGYANQDIKVQMYLIDREGNEQLAGDPVFVRPTSPLEEMNIELTYKPVEAGEFRFKIRALPMPGEKALRNNELDAFLTVNDKGMRILYVNGSLGFEQMSLRRSLATADFIEVDFQLVIPKPSKPPAGLAKLQSLFEDPTYDIFILDDVDARTLSNSKGKARPLEALAKAVNDGKGLIMLGGTHSFGAGDYADTALADVLPIEMSPAESQPFDKDIRRELHINREIKLKPTRNHYLTKLGDSGLDAWVELPPLAGANRFEAVKNNALVLLESDDEARSPILVATNVGVGGRVLAFAGDSTRRWNYYRLNNDPKQRTFKQEYDQFWRQIILWLAYWDSKNDETVSIDLPQRRFSPRPRIRFGVSAKTVAGETQTDVQFEARLTQPNGDQVMIPVQRSGNEFYSEVDPDAVAAAGLYRIDARGARDGQMIGESARDFVVMDRDKEKSNPVADPDKLTKMANETKPYGGRAMVPEDVGPLLDEFIANPPIEKITVPTTWRMGDSQYDSGGFLLLFVLVLAVEWFLRKKWQLV